MEYNYTSTDPVLGEEHTLPVILQLKKGKQVRILLKGRTLEADQTFLRVLSSDFQQEMRIGDLAPPEYTLRVFNPSAVSLAYELDMQPLAALKRDNYGCDVIKCENPKGVIESGQISSLKWTFRPLEAKTYAVDTTVSYFPPGRLTRPLQLSKMKVPLRIRCHGTHHRDGNKKYRSKIRRPQYSLPTSQEVLVPGQTAKLSHDQINFGNIPQDAKTHRLVVLRSLGDTVTQFQWDDEHPLLKAKTVKIYPMKGRLAAGAHVVIRVSLKANAMPSTVAREIGLVLTPVSNNGQPLAEDKTFVGITTSAYVLDKLTEPNRAQSVGKSQANGAKSTTSYRSSKQKPARQSVITARTASHINRELANTRLSVMRGLPVTQELARKDHRAYRAPEETEEKKVVEIGPQQCVLHLRLSFSIRDRESLDNKCDFYCSAIENPIAEPEETGLNLTKRVGEHKDVLISVTGSMIRDAIQDPSVKATLEQLHAAGSRQPVPYYAQLAADHARIDANETEPEGLNNPLHADVCHRVLEETFYNLVQEVLQGEVRLDRPPRVVLNRKA